MPLRCMPSGEVAMEHQFFIRQQNLKLFRSLVATSEAAAAKADARQEKLKATGRGSRERTARKKLRHQIFTGIRIRSPQ